jgi:hypothetical protein
MSFRTNNSFGCIVLLFIITIGVILTLNSSLSKSEYYLGCSSSEECYSLFKDKAKSFQTKGIELFRLSNPNDESIGQKDAINSIYNPDSRMNDPNISGTEETLHPQVAKNAFEPPVKAAFVVLARNDEVFRLMSSMRHLENRFNKKFNYPWVFLNEEPFSDEFKELTSKMTNAEVHYGLIPVEHWSYPDWINQTFAAEARVEMGKNHVGKGEIEAYHHMIRYQSGFFMKHPLLEDMDYYW